MNISILYFFFDFTWAHPFVARVAIFFSDYLVYILPLVVVLYIYVYEKQPFKKVLYTTLVVVIAVLATDYVFKEIFTVARPFAALGFTPLTSEAGFSFPSGHATLAGALFGATYFSISKHQWFTVLVGILCLGIGISRIMLGVHYPADILAGFSVGFLISIIGYTIERRFL